MLPLKEILQQVRKEKKDWDKKLPAELSAKFQQWLLKATTEIERCNTKNKEIKEIVLAGFCNASKIGHAAYIYLCTKYADEYRSVKNDCCKDKGCTVKQPKHT